RAPAGAREVTRGGRGTHQHAAQPRHVRGDAVPGLDVADHGVKVPTPNDTKAKPTIRAGKLILITLSKRSFSPHSASIQNSGKITSPNRGNPSQVPVYAASTTQPSAKTLYAIGAVRVRIRAMIVQKYAHTAIALMASPRSWLSKNAIHTA